MPNAPEISGQDSETTQVRLGNLAAELDAPDDVEVKAGDTATPASADTITTTDTIIPPVEETKEPAEDAATKEAVADSQVTDETTAGDKPPEEVKEPSAEQLEMIRLLRQMRKELSIANAKQQRQEEELRRLRQASAKPASEFDDDDLMNSGSAGKPPASKQDETVPLSELEQLQLELSETGSRRSESLVTIAETMAVNPKYEDVKEVCSRSNLNDLIDAMAAKVAADQGIDPVVAALKIENAIWKQPNPYLWMYETIKSNHPRYAKQTQPVANTSAAPPAATTARTPKPAEAPPSVTALGPTDTAQGTGWTAAKLDAMDEMEFSKVPANVRQMYLTGQL